MVLNGLSCCGVVHDGVDVLEEDTLLREVGVGLNERQRSLEIHDEVCEGSMHAARTNFRVGLSSPPLLIPFHTDQRHMSRILIHGFF